MKFCKDCAYYVPPIFTDKCAVDATCVGAPKVEVGISMVTGEMIYQHFSNMCPEKARYTESDCGREAKWFKVKE